MVLDYFRSVPSRLQQKGLQGLASDQAEIDAEEQRRQEEAERAKQLEQIRKQYDEATAASTQPAQEISFRDDLLSQAKSRYEELTGHIGQGVSSAAGNVGNAIGQYGQQAGDALGQMGQARDEAMQQPARAVPDALGTAARGVADAAGGAIDQGPVGDYGRWREETQRQEPNGLEDIAALAPSQDEVLADRAAEAAAGVGSNRRQQQNLREKGLLGGTAANVASAVTGQGLSPEEQAQREHVERLGGYGAQAGRTLGSAVAGALGAEKPGEDVAQGNFQPTKQVKELDAQGNWTGKMVEAPETEGGLKKAVRDIGEQVATFRGEGTRNENPIERAQAGMGAAMTAAFGIPTEMAKGAVGRTTGDPVSAEIAGAGASILGPGGVGFGSVGRTAGPMLEGAKAAGILDAPITAAVKAAIKERGLAETASALGIEIGALVGPFLGMKTYQDAKAQGKNDEQAVAAAIEAGSQPIQLGELGGLGAGAASAGVAGARAIPKLPDLPRGLLERGGNITPDMSLGEGLRGAAGTALRQGTAAVRSAVGSVAEDYRAAQQARLDAARAEAGRPATALGATAEPSPPPGRGQAATPDAQTPAPVTDVDALQAEVKTLRQQQGQAAGALGKALGKGFRGDPNRVPEGLTPETQGIWDVYVQAARRTKEINDTLTRARQGGAPVDPLAALAEPTGTPPPNVPRQGRGSYQVPAEVSISGGRDEYGNSRPGQGYPATAKSLMGEPESPTRPHQDETLRRDAELRAEGGLGDGDRLTGGETATFYSALQRAVQQLPDGKLSPAQLSKQLLAQPDVKREQMVWSGLDDYLTGKLQANNGKGEAVTKPELQQWLTDHDVRVYEIQKGSASDPAEAQRLQTTWKEAEAAHTPLLHRMQQLERTAEDRAYTILGAAEERLRQTPEGQLALDPTGMGYGRDLYTEASQFVWSYPNVPKDRPFFDALAESQIREGRDPDDPHVPTPEEKEAALHQLSPLYAALTPDERAQLEQIRTEVQAVNEEYGLSSERVEDAKQRYENVNHATLPGGDTKWVEYAGGGLYLPGAAEPHAHAREFLLTLGPRTDMPDYNGPHWDEQNVVAHIRMTTRTTLDGKKVLLIEELQSDWHQAARRKRKDNQNRPLLDEQGKPIRLGYYQGRRLPEEVRASPEYARLAPLREEMVARRAEYEAFTNTRRLDDAREAFHAAEQEALGRAQQKLIDAGIPEEMLPEIAQGGWFGRKVDDRGERQPDPIVMVKYTFPPGTPVEQASMHGMLSRNAVDPLSVEVVKWTPGYWRAGDSATLGVRRLSEEARELNINRVDDPNAPTVFYGTRGGERVLLDIAQQDPEVAPLKEALRAEEAEFERVTNAWHDAENAERIHRTNHPDLKDVERTDEIERKRAQLEAAEADPDIVAWYERDRALKALEAAQSRAYRNSSPPESDPDVQAARDTFYALTAAHNVKAPPHTDADNPTPEYRDWEARMAGIDAKRRQVEYLRSNLEGLESEARWTQGHFPQTDKPPAGPFQGEGWQRLALKRMLHLAAQEGYDYLGITPGDIQAQRYNPFRGQGIEALEYSRHTQTLTIERAGERVAEEKVAPEQLAEYVGEGVANALLRQPKGDPIEAARRAEPGAFGTNRVTAEDWEGGLVAEDAMGVGMRKAYDQILPSLLAETARRFGAEVKIAPETDPARALTKGQTEPAVLLDPNKRPDEIVEEGSEEGAVRERPNLQPAHLLEITPQMQEAQAQPGGMLPLFIRPPDGTAQDGAVPGAGMSRGARMADDLGTATGGVLGAARGYQESEEEDAARRARGEAGLSGIDRASQTVFGGVKGAAIGKVATRGARVARLLTEPGMARGNALADLRDALPKPPGSPGSTGMGEELGITMRPTTQFDTKLHEEFVAKAEGIEAKIATQRAKREADAAKGKDALVADWDRKIADNEARLVKLQKGLDEAQRPMRAAQTFPAGPTREELAGGFTAFGQRSQTLPTGTNPFGADPGTPEFDAGRIFSETPPGQPVRPVLADGTPAMGSPGDLDRGNVVLVPRPDPSDPTGKKEIKVRVNSRDGDLAPVDEVNRYIDKGAHGQHWYTEIAHMIREAATDLNGKLHTDVLAELAPLFGRTGHKTTPEHNYEAMLRLFLARNLIETQGRGKVPDTLDEMQSAMRAVDPGKGGSPLFTDIYNSVVDMWRGGRAFIAGNLKLSQYSGVIADQAEGGISHWIVPDAWIFRALGYKNPSEAASDPVASRFAQAYIASIAEQRGISPAEAQAMLWTGYRLENPEEAAVKIMEGIFNARGLTFNKDDLGLPPSIRTFNADLLQRFRQALTDGQFSVTLPGGRQIDVPMQPHQDAKNLEVAFVLPENRKTGTLPYASTNVTRRASQQFVGGVRAALPDGQRLATQHQQGGQTSWTTSGQPIPAGTSVVRLFPERTRRIPGQVFDPVSWAGFRAQNHDLLQDPRLGVVTWYNPDDGHTHFDVVVAATPAQVQALAALPPNRSIQERLDGLSGVANGGASTPTPGGRSGDAGLPDGGRSRGVAPGGAGGPGPGSGDRGAIGAPTGAAGIIAGGRGFPRPGGGRGRGADDLGGTGASSAPGGPASPDLDLGSAAGAEPGTGTATGAFDPEAVKRANRTSRTAGKFGEDALVPKLIPQLFTPEEAGAVLDFGSGKPPTHAVTLRGQGYDVTAHDFGTNVDPEMHDPDALTRQYDTVYASRVLNVQENAGMMDQTLAQIAGATKPDGTVILNYPGDPRRWDDPSGPKLNGVGKTSPATVLAHLQKHFGTVEQINKDNARPIWRASDPITARSPESQGLVPADQAGTIPDAGLGDAIRTVSERFGLPSTRGDVAASGVGAALGGLSEAMEPGDEDEDTQERMWRILSGAGTGAATGLTAKRGGARAGRALPRVLGNLPDLGRTDGLGSRNGAENGIIAPSARGNARDSAAERTNLQARRAETEARNRAIIEDPEAPRAMGAASGPSVLPQLPPTPPEGRVGTGSSETPKALKPYGKGDLINDFQRFNMLWNPYTVLKQVAGGVASGPLQVGSRYVAWAVNQIPANATRVTGKDSFLGMPKEDVFLGEGGAQMIGALSSIGDAFKDAISALQGKDPHSAQVLAQAGMGGQNAQAGQRPTSNAFMAGAQKAFRGSGNVYEAFTNAWLRTLAESGDYAGYAYRQAMQNTSGKGKQQGKSFRNEYSRLMQQRHNPTDADAKAIKARSTQGAKYRTLTQELEGLSAGVEDLRKYQGARFLLPFWQVPFNDVKFGLEHTPAGAVKTVLDTARGKQTNVAEGTPDANGKLPTARESTAAVSERLARSIVGTGMAVGVYNLAMADLITGGMPDDPTERELWQTEGRTPYSIRLGGQWVPLTQLSGYTAALTAGADAAAEMKRHARTGKPMDAAAAANLAARVVSRFVEAQANKPLLDGINDLTELTSATARRDDITSGEGPAGRWLASTIGRFIPGSSLAASAVQASDPYFREANTIGERISARLPRFSGNLEPQRDPLGRPIARGGFAEGGEGDNKLVRALPWASRDIRPRLGRYPNTNSIEADMTAAEAARKVDAYYKDAANNPRPTREEFILAAQADEPQYRYAEGKRLAKSRKEATAAGKPVPAHIDPALRALVPQGGGGQGGGGLPKASPVARLLLAR